MNEEKIKEILEENAKLKVGETPTIDFTFLMFLCELKSSRV